MIVIGIDNLKFLLMQLRNSHLYFAVVEHYRKKCYWQGILKVRNKIYLLISATRDLVR